MPHVTASAYEARFAARAWLAARAYLLGEVEHESLGGVSLAVHMQSCFLGVQFQDLLNEIKSSFSCLWAPQNTVEHFVQLILGGEGYSSSFKGWTCHT